MKSRAKANVTLLASKSKKVQGKRAGSRHSTPVSTYRARVLLTIYLLQNSLLTLVTSNSNSSLASVARPLRPVPNWTINKSEI